MRNNYENFIQLKIRPLNEKLILRREIIENKKL